MVNIFYMRLFTKYSTALCCCGLLLMAGCRKSTVQDATDNTVRSTSLHGYGLNQMTPQEWAAVPVFSADVLRKTNKQITGLTYNGTLPANYLLVSPQIRDQGQIGSCTGFCGAETNEILYYYQNNNITGAAITSALTTANGLSTALSNEIANTSEETAYGAGNSIAAAHSPLFLYYVERVVISKNKIGSDPGANMVNIGEALQGLSSNGGSGTALTSSGYTFAGISNESLYPYPFVTGSGGYNVATASTAPYTTPPYTYYNYGSTAIPVYPNNFTIGKQSGGTTSSNGVTSQGYYVINSTKSQLVTDVKTAIANNKPVMMGFNVYDKSPTYPYFEALSTTSYTYNPLNSNGRLASGIRLMGGHAVPIIGYINDASQPGGGVFICQNSWGTPWGFHGYFYLPYSVLQSTTIVPAGSLYVAII
jgi:hypothetical protein